MREQLYRYAAYHWKTREMEGFSSEEKAKDWLISMSDPSEYVDTLGIIYQVTDWEVYQCTRTF